MIADVLDGYSVLGYIDTWLSACVQIGGNRVVALQGRLRILPHAEEMHFASEFCTIAHCYVGSEGK